MKKWLVILFFTFHIAYANALPNPKTIVVTSKEELLQALNEVYSGDTILIRGIIHDVKDLPLPNDLTLKGEGDNDGLVGMPNSRLLLVGQNDTIRNLTLTVAHDANVAIENRYPVKVGLLNINQIRTNGTIQVTIVDGSFASRINIENTLIELHSPGNAIHLGVYNNSGASVTNIDSNEINLFGADSVGLESITDSGGTLVYDDDIANNKFLIAGADSTAIAFEGRNVAGWTRMQGSIHDNHIKLINDAEQTGNGIAFKTLDSGQIVAGDIINNDITGGAHGFHFEAEGTARTSGLYLQSIKNNQVEAKRPFAAVANGGGIIQFGNIMQNTFEAGVGEAAIYNQAMGYPSVIDFDGALDSVIPAQNTLLVNGAPVILNQVKNGGVIK